MRQAVILCSFLCLYSQLYSQSGNANAEDSIKTITLESVIFTYEVSDLSKKGLNSDRLRNGVETNLSNALDHIPGFFKIHEAGFPLVYRGMSANRLRIEHNGALRTGVVDQGYLTDDINPGTVNIRVVRGIESTLYGSGAIGGVIRFDEPSFGSIANKRSIYLAYSSNNSSKTAGLELSGKNDQSGFRFASRTNSTDDFQFGSGETALNSAQGQNSLNLSLFRRNKARTHQLTWSNNYSNSDTERPQGFQNNPFEFRKYRNHFTYQTNLESQAALKNGVILKQNLWALWLDTDQELRNFNGDFSRLNVSENRNYQKQAFGYRGKLALQPSPLLALQVGADFTGSWLDQQNIRQDFINQIFDENTFTQSRVEQMAGLFGLAEYKLKGTVLGIAIRADIASIGTREQQEHYTTLSGGLELTHSQKDRYTNIISLTRKFRYPTQQESVGVLFGGRGTFFGNPDLKPEYGYQLEWTRIRKLNNQFDIALTSWFALFENRIAEFFLGNSEFSYRNLDKARTMGLEARLDYKILGLDSESSTTLSFSGTFTQGDNLGNEGIFAGGTPLIGIPPGRMRLSALHNRNIRTNLSLQAHANVDYVLPYNRLPSGSIRQTFGVIETEAYPLVDLGFKAIWKLNHSSLEFGLNIANLTDKAYFPFGARIMGVGRNVTGSLRYNF
ncbi:MAG: TonB-dependent receptor plug domain-containing protein [Roseivirga sp.]|nr:TonB-dependent receptor plug domain-containing protein [Roseivirga sp.]